jgi:hypothetical protein
MGIKDLLGNQWVRISIAILVFIGIGVATYFIIKKLREPFSYASASCSQLCDLSNPGGRAICDSSDDTGNAQCDNYRRCKNICENKQREEKGEKIPIVDPYTGGYVIMS